MSKSRGPTLSRDWDKLTKQLARARPVPSPTPDALPLGKIKLWSGAFQHRGRRGHDGESHVRELAASIKKSSSRTLAPVEVWWDGRHWACIDGHHRIDAYGAAEVGSDHLVPVVVFTGTLADAMGRAAAANTKDKLPMTRSEKSNAAWRLVTTTDLSKAATAAASGASESTVAAMRRAHAALLKMAAATDDLESSRVGDLRDMTWMNANALAKGKEPADFDRGAANEEKAQTMAAALARALGREGAKYPEILARALDIYDCRLMDHLVDWWALKEDKDDDVSEGAALGL